MTRQFWVIVHRFAGLYLAFFLAVAGLTGSLLAFMGEIHGWLNPPMRIAPQPRPQLDEFTLRDRVEARVPHAIVNLVNFRRKPDEAYVAGVEPRLDPATGKHYTLGFTSITLDPYTGAELSQASDDGVLWPITRKNIMLLVLALHYRLAIPGSIGVWLFGISAIVWTIDCFVGFFLTLPRQAPRAAGDPSGNAPPPHSWWTRWMSSWRFRWGGSSYRVQFNLHRASGLWVWPMLLVFALSAVALNLGEEVYNPVMKALFGMSEDALSLTPVLPKPRPVPGLAWREAHQIGQRLAKEQAEARGFKIKGEDLLGYDDLKGQFLYLIRTDSDLPRESGGTIIVFDGDTGSFGGLSQPTGENAANTFTHWITYIHMAQIWGLPMKIAVCIMGLVITMLSATGVYLWWRRSQIAVKA